MKKRKGNIINVIVLIMVCTVLAVAEYESKTFAPQMQLGGNLDISKMREQNLQLVQKAVEGIGETLPQRIDPYTTMVGIDSNGTKLIYTFEVDAGPKSDEALRQEGRERMAPLVRRGICRSAERFLKSGIDIAYRYLNKSSGREILRVDVSEKDCQAEDRR